MAQKFIDYGDTYLLHIECSNYAVCGYEEKLDGEEAVDRYGENCTTFELTNERCDICNALLNFSTQFRSY